MGFLHSVPASNKTYHRCDHGSFPSFEYPRSVVARGDHRLAPVDHDDLDFHCRLGMDGGQGEDVCGTESAHAIQLCTERLILRDEQRCEVTEEQARSLECRRDTRRLVWFDEGTFLGTAPIWFRPLIMFKRSDSSTIVELWDMIKLSGIHKARGCQASRP
jgi:hypothetical protein